MSAHRYHPWQIQDGEIMTALDAWRESQHEHHLYDSDHAWTAFMHTVTPEAALLDRIAHASEVELHMLFRR